MAFGSNLSKKSKLFRIIRSVLVWKFLLYLKFWAKITVLIHRPIIIGIAGAVGKSTARQALSAIITPFAPTLTIEGNSETGIPLGILGLDHGTYSLFDWLKIIMICPFRITNLRGYHYLIIEYGIDGPHSPKNMGYLLTIVTPSIALLLNESAAHVGNYDPILSESDKQLSVADQIEKIVDFMTTDDGKLLQSHTVASAIVNADDSRLYQFATQHVPRGNLFTFGTDIANDIAVTHAEVTEQGSRYLFAIHSHQIKDSLEIAFPSLALPEAAGGVLGSAILTAVHIGIPLSTIKSNLENNFRLPPGRGSLFAGINETLIVDSSYNASSASVLSFLSILKNVKKETRRPTAFLFGDMKELGLYSESEHDLVAKTLPGTADHIFLVGNITKQFVLPYLQKHKDKFKTIMWFNTVLEASTYLQQNLPSKTILLVKGSQNLEEVIKPLLKSSKDASKLCRQELFWEKAKKQRNVWITK